MSEPSIVCIAVIRTGNIKIKITIIVIPMYSDVISYIITTSNRTLLLLIYFIDNIMLTDLFCIGYKYLPNHTLWYVALKQIV